MIFSCFKSFVFVFVFLLLGHMRGTDAKKREHHVTARDDANSQYLTANDTNRIKNMEIKQRTTNAINQSNGDQTIRHKRNKLSKALHFVVSSSDQHKNEHIQQARLQTSNKSSAK